MFHDMEGNVGHWYLFVVDLISRKGYVMDSCILSDQSGRIGDCHKMICCIFGKFAYILLGID